MINEYDIKHMSEERKLCLKLAEESSLDTTYMNDADVKSLARFMQAVAEQSALVALEHQQFAGALAIRNFFNIPLSAPCALLNKRFPYES